jgi:hypothetical protein
MVRLVANYSLVLAVPFLIPANYHSGFSWWLGAMKTQAYSVDNYYFEKIEL